MAVVVQECVEDGQVVDGEWEAGEAERNKDGRGASRAATASLFCSFGR